MDPITGNFPGWQVLPLAAGILFLGLAAWLLVSFFRSCNSAKLYSYSTVAKLGFALFLILVAVLRLRYYFLYSATDTFYGMLAGFVFSFDRVMHVILPFILLFGLALIVSNIALVIHEGLYPANLYAFLTALAFVGTALLGYELGDPVHRIYVPNGLYNAYCALVCYFNCLLVAVIVCIVISAGRNPDHDKDYVLILGCKVRDDGSLYPIIRSRVDRAMRFVDDEEKDGKRAVFLPTGGKGSDEKLSEAEAMQKYLLEHGVDAERIKPETKSKTTRENMLFSKAIVDSDDAKVIFSTSDFHVFRSGILASSLGWPIEGIGSKSKWYFWPNAATREFIGLLYESRISQLIVMAVLCIFAVLIAQAV